ncbi:MAG: ACP phosphodiesterase [Campylobacterota bacterium]|nr:ACP phosphodiesterase [Campylobacterota bacterium]
MNWLAHVFLSQKNIEHQLGNLLTDPLKAKAWDGASDAFLRGIENHLRIDSFTDAHSIVSSSKKILTHRGHLKGVVLDVLYDHFLSLHWDKYCTVKREKFLEDFRMHALATIPTYPNKAQNVIQKVVHHKQLTSYEHMDGVVAAFGRIDNRLSDRARSKDTCTRYIPLIAESKEELEEAFLAFFPELMAMVKKECKLKTFEHWKI